jgi:hypothetical protein
LEGRSTSAGLARRRLLRFAGLFAPSTAISALISAAIPKSLLALACFKDSSQKYSTLRIGSDLLQQICQQCGCPIAFYGDDP